uniref:F-box domain-containing protein n=1 Tax=Parastrongyloides trichosuri TaxID=131310 RepID=A0A0N5A5Q7_PARTI
MSDDNVQKQIDESNSLTEICTIVRKNGFNGNYQVHKKYNKIETDTRNLSKSDKEVLAKKYSSFIEFLFDVLPNCTRINIKNINKFEDFDSFLIFIIKNIKSDKVKTIGLYDIFQILYYAKDFNLLENDIFGNMSNLDKVVLYLDKWHNLKTLETFENEFETFLTFLSSHKYLNYEFEIRNNQLCYETTCRIIKYGRSNDLKIRIKHLSFFSDMYFEEDAKENDTIQLLMHNVSYACVNIEEMEDFKKLKIILNNFDSLVILKVELEYNFLINNLKNIDNDEELIEKLKNALNYTCPLRKLNILELNTWQEYECENEKYNLLMEKIFEIILSIFPNTITELSLFVNNFTSSISNYIALKFPYLKTIELYPSKEMDVEAFSKMKSLKNVIYFFNVRKVDIPEWIEIVKISWLNSEIVAYKNEDFFEEMNSTFNFSLKQIEENGINEIIFGRNVLNWKDYMKLERNY